MEGPDELLFETGVRNRGKGWCLELFTGFFAVRTQEVLRTHRERLLERRAPVVPVHLSSVSQEGQVQARARIRSQPGPFHCASTEVLANHRT
jgi:hypothetical protein